MAATIDENLLLLSSKFVKQEEYWKNKLSGIITVTDILRDGKGKTNTQKKEEKAEITLPYGLCKRVMKLSKASNLSIYIILMAALKSLIYRYASHQDIIVVSPLNTLKVSGETINNKVFIRDRVEGDMTFKELLIQIRQSVLEAYENQDYPWDKLIEHLSRESTGQGDEPVSNIVCSLAPLHENTNIREITGKLSFLFQRKDDRIRAHIFYESNCYDKNYTEQISRHLINILEESVKTIDIKISKIPLLSKQEKERLLIEFNNNKVNVPRDKTVHEYFEEQVVKQPDNIAVVYEELNISYRDMNKRTGHLASVLRRKGVKPGSIVGIMLERSLEMLISIIGTLKAGGAYLPIVPIYPVERIRYILQDSGTETLITRDIFSRGIGDTYPGNALDILIPWDANGFKDEPMKIANMNTSRHLAYVIYTSGSTGKPKGVMVEHQQVIHLVHGLNEVIYKKYVGKLNAALIAPYEFDASVQQISASLLLGHTLYIVPDNTRLDSGKLLEYYKKCRIDITDGTPTHIRLLMENLDGNTMGLGIKHFIIAGDVLPKAVVKNFLNCFAANIHVPQITNLYGPTETCVDSTYYHIPKENPDEFDTIPIGKPLPNEQVYILNRENSLQPVGVPGELCIGGAGVTRGYLNRPELTAEKFDRDLWDYQDYQDAYHRSYRSYKSYIIYKTGDLAKWLPDGNIEFIGRMDQQVKVRGRRIELGEIEYWLLKHDEIKEAVVKISKEEGEKRLCAYIVSDSDLTVPELKEFLSGNLPGQMIPEHFIKLDEMPLKSNGKIDREALDLLGTTLGTGVEYAAPQNEAQKIIADIWTEVLKPDNKVSIDDNFFDVGGNSMNIIKVNNKLNEAMGTNISVLTMFDYPTINSLYNYLTQQKAEKTCCQSNREKDSSAQALKEFKDAITETIQLFENI